MTLPLPPLITPSVGIAAFKTILARQGILVTLQTFHAGLGDIFRLPLPGGAPIVLAGPEAGHFVSVTARQSLGWRNEGDPVTSLLRHGLLVEDRDSHDDLRRSVMPSLQRRRMGDYAGIMLRRTDQIADAWDTSRSLDMLVEMRRIALLILMDTLFDVDVTADLDRLMPVILRTLAYISPGAWLVWRGIPRPGFDSALQTLNDYFYRLIAERRARGLGDDLLSSLIAAGMDDELIRDQLLTLFIAGHDTSTALLAWVLYHLGKYPDVQGRARAERDTVLAGEDPAPENLGQLVYLGQVIDETLRLYPPIHVGNRVVLEDLEFKGCRIPAGRRLMYSIFLTHRDEKHWPDSGRFDPERFAPSIKPAPYTFVPFGGGPRNCIGSLFAQVESKIVLARLLQRFKFTLLDNNIHMHMGATLEPRPAVVMRVTQR